MVTPLYAAVITALYVFLSFRTLLLRRKHGVAVGTGGNATLERAIAVHANCAEYAPLALLLIFFLEDRIGTTWTIHALCIALILGRAIHAYGVSQVHEDTRLRVVGMVLTLSCLIAVSLRLLTAYWG